MIRNLIVNINSDRSVFPKELKVANRYEIKTNVLNIKFSFDLPENSFVYLVLTRNQIQYYYPLINNSFSFDSNETWINGGWIGYVLISKAEIIDGVVNSSEALFISDAFGLTVGDSEFNIEKLEQQELPAQLHLLYDDLLHLKAELEELIRNGDFSDLSITIDSALSKTSENPVQNKVITEEFDKLKESIDDLKENGVSGGSGLTKTQKALMITLFRNMLSQNDMSDTVDALENSFNSTSEPDEPDEPDTPEEPDVPVEPTNYTIKYNLTNVTSSMSDTSITSGNPFTTTLTPSDGYALGTVTVTMGGIEVTNSVYKDGVIAISNVSGNIVINAIGVEAGNATAWEDGVPYTFSIIEGEYVSPDDGSFISGAGEVRTDYIPCLGVDYLYFSKPEGSATRRYNAFFDENKNFVSGVELRGVRYLEIPSNVAYLVISYYPLVTSGECTVTPCVISEGTWEDGVSYDLTPFIENSWIKNGELTYEGGTGWKSTEKINCANASKLVFSTPCKWSSFYDKLGNIISGSFVDKTDVEVPKYATYVAISNYNATMDSLVVTPYK